MKRLTVNDLALVAGMAAAKKIGQAWPNLWVQEQEEGDIHRVSWKTRQPWDGKSLEIHLDGQWITVPVSESIVPQAISAVAQAALESQPLNVRVADGRIVDVWL